MEYDLEPMMKPKSVAIVGASRDPDKVGHIILQNYINGGYSGRLYVVNKNADEVMGFKSYKSVSDIKERLDLVVVAVPAQIVPDIIEECGKSKARSVVVVSGGFAEIGQSDLQDKMAAIARRYKLPVLGPNCLGVEDPRSKVDTLFLPTFKLSKAGVGSVSFVSQSGAVGSTVLDMMSGEGFGLSKFISYGNAAVVDEVDILNYLLKDNETKVIVMYLEGLKRGKEFVEVARRVTKVKPIIILKAGRTEAGIAAAHSHTASLAGNYEDHEAVFKQFGLTVANDLNELIYYAKAFVAEPEPKGANVAIITNGGGAGVLTTDAIGNSKYLKLAEFSNETKKVLAKTMPPLVNLRNPLDLAGDADKDRYNHAIEAVANDKNVDMVIAIVLFQTPGADSGVAASVAHYKESIDKPLVVISIGAEYTQTHVKMMEESGVPVYDSPVAAVKSLEELLKYKMYKARH